MGTWNVPCHPISILFLDESAPCRADAVSAGLSLNSPSVSLNDEPEVRILEREKGVSSGDVHRMSED